MVEQIINIDSEIMGGTPVFMGTRVPIKALFDYIEGGETLDAFFEDFPGVRREQVFSLLKMAQLEVVGKQFAIAA